MNPIFTVNRKTTKSVYSSDATRPLVCAMPGLSVCKSQKQHTLQ